MFTMGEGTFDPERALAHFPVSANLCFELLLKVRLGGHDFPGLNRDNIEVGEPAELVVDLGIIS